MLGCVCMNGMAKRRKRTLKFMVRSTITHTTLPNSLYGKALMTTVYLLKKAPTKATKNNNTISYGLARSLSSSIYKCGIIKIRQDFISLMRKAICKNSH